MMISGTKKSPYHLYIVKGTYRTDQSVASKLKLHYHNNDVSISKFPLEQNKWQIKDYFWTFVLSLILNASFTLFASTYLGNCCLKNKLMYVLTTVRHIVIYSSRSRILIEGVYFKLSLLHFTTFYILPWSDI